MAVLVPSTPCRTDLGPNDRGCWWLVAFILTLLAGSGAGAQTKVSHEYQIKAVFLFNFVRFVEWPPSALADSQAPLVIGVLGEDPFGSFLDETVRGETMDGHPLIVQRYRRMEDIGICHVLFISKSEANRLELILSKLRGRHILTVGDTDLFALRGGMIGCVTENNKTRLKINVEAAKADGLIISSKLLRPAEIVTAGET